VAILLAVVVALLPTAPAGALPPDPPGVAQTEDALELLTVARRASLRGYDRALFGTRWVTVGDGCDVRERVLQRDGRRVRVGDDCEAVSGRWRSVYDGKVLRRAASVDIDHIVPLANAWRSGARDWTLEQRNRFANDLAGPQLIAVSAASNRSKGDSGPEEWKPPRRIVWCLYARWWIDVKTSWRLTVSAAERKSLRAMLATCMRR
jgi:hypothetical protein